MLKYTVAFYQGKINGLNTYLSTLEQYLGELEGYRQQLYSMWQDEIGEKVSVALNETIISVKGEILQIKNTLAYLNKTATEYNGASEEAQSQIDNALNALKVVTGAAGSIAAFA